MIPHKFDYHRPKSVEEAIELITSLGDTAQFLAGGHSLLPAMKLRLNDPKHLIDIGRISDLSFIKDEGNKIVVGATTTHRELTESVISQAKMPLLVQVGKTIGDPAVRTKGTIGGSIAHADPAADWPAVLLASGAVINVQGPNGSRQIAAADFFVDIFETALADNELIISIEIPMSAYAERSAYVKFKQPASRFAIVGCAAIALLTPNNTFQNVRVAFTGVSEKPFRDHNVEQLLNGQEINYDTIFRAAVMAAEGASILSDHYASEKYRKHLAKVYAQRALIQLAS